MMHYRDLYIQGASNFQDVQQVLIRFLQPSGKPFHTGQSIERPVTHYVAQPEALLLKINQVLDLSLQNSEFNAFDFRIRIQPYNLPDEEDQKTLLHTVPEQIVQCCEQSCPRWILKLSPLY